MKNKKIATFACLSILGALALTGCSSAEIIAKPSYYDQHIINGDNGDNYKVDDIYNNLYSLIYDSYHSGSTFTTDVLTTVLGKYAASIFGEYNLVTAPKGYNGITLKKAYANTFDGGDVTITKKFIDEHKAYQVTNDKGERDSTREISKVRAVYNSIDERIAKKMYAKISGETYTERNSFSEEKFADALRHDLQNLDVNSTTVYFEGLILPSVREEDVFEPIEQGEEPVLHRGIYQSNYGYGDTESKDQEGRYIEENIIPAIYSDLLVEEYIFEESYNVIGRSNGRKVNIIAVTPNSDDLDAAKNLITSFRDRIFTPIKDVTESGVTYGPEVSLDDFNSYSKVWNGIYDDLSVTKTIRGAGGMISEVDLGNAVFTKGTVTDNHVSENATQGYIGSDYGKIVKEYNKITDDPYTTDTTIENDYTNSGAYPKEVGLMLKRNTVTQKNHVTDGWYIKSNGLTDLPETIKNRLFNLAVASDYLETFEEGEDNERAKISGNTITYEKDEDESKYVAKINGKYYLKTSSQSQGSDDKDDIVFFDNSSSSYYIIQVEEAACTSKFSKNSKSTNVYGSDKLPVVENAIAELVANTESYQTLAKKHWVSQMGLNDMSRYHDQSIYNYFVETYPDIFK